MGVAEDYLKLRTKRTEKDEEEKKTRVGTASSSTGSQATAQSVGAEYLKLREEGEPPKLSLPQLPAAAGKTGKNLPAVNRETGGGTGQSGAASDVPSLVPEWAQQMIDRYKPAENIPKSPVAQWESQKREQAGQSGGPSLKDWGSLAKDTAMAGVGQISKASASLFSATEQLLTRPMGWIMGNPELYKDFPLYRLNQGTKRDMEILQSNLSQSAAATGKAGELVAQFGPGTIAALPQAALVYLTAGASLMAQGTTAGLQAASTAAQLSGASTVAGTVMNAAKAMAVNPSFQYSFLNTVGGEFEQALEDGADAPTAYAYAALTALANSAVEVGGGIDTLPDELRGKNKNQLLEWVKSMFDEGKEEVIQGAISQLMQKGVYGKNNPLYSSTDENAVINPGRMAGDFAGGAVVGGILGGGQTILQNAINRSATRSFQDEVMAQMMGENVQEAPENAPPRGAGPTEEDASRAVPRERAGEGAGPYRDAREVPGVRSFQDEVMAQMMGENVQDVPENAPPTEAAVNDGPGARSFQDEVMAQMIGEDAREVPENAGEPGFSAEGEVFSKGDRRLLDNLGKITGTNIQIVSREELARITGREDANGVQMGGQIYLSEAAERPLLEVAKHEMTHRLQDTAPDAYGAFRDYVAGVYRESGTLERYIEGMIRSREQAGLQLTEEQALDEIAADYAGELMLDQDAVRRLAGEDRGLLERMLDGLREVIRTIKSALGIGQNGTDAQVEELEEAARLWQNALEESAAQVSSSDASDPRYSIRETGDGKKYVQADRMVITGQDPAVWAEQVEDYINGKIRRGQDVQLLTEDGDVLTLTRETAGKAKHAFRPDGSRMTESEYETKLNAEVHIDELAQVSKKTGERSDVDRRHGDFASKGWQYRTAYFRDFDGQTYQVGISVAQNTQGNIVYNIGSIRKRSLSTAGFTASGSSVKDGAQGGKASSMDTIPHAAQDVNGDEAERSFPPVTGSSADGGAQKGGKASSMDTIAQPETEVKGLELPSLEDRSSDTETGQAEIPGENGLRGLELPGLETDTWESTTETPESFSMEGDAALKKEVERLRRQNQRLKEQTKRTDIPRRNREAVAGQARDLLRSYSSQLDAADVTDRLQTLWDHQAAKNGTPWERDKAPTWEEIKAEARTLAQDILENSESQVNDLFEEYRDLRKELRGTRLSVPPEYRGDLESAGGYNDLRKQYFGKLRLGSDGPGVDQVYDDLASRYPELFPDDIIHPADQLLRITDVIDELEPVVGNPYEAEMDRAAEYLAGDLIERFYDTPQEKPTFADKQAKKLAEQRKKDREEFQARLYRQRRETDQRIKRVQEKNKEANRKRMENQNAAQRRETIRRHANRLGKMLLRPTDKQHIPEELRGAVLKFVQSLNLESGYSKDLGGNRVQAQEGEQMGLPTKRSEAARELQEQYKALAGKGGFTIDPDMDGYLDELAGMKDTPLSKLSNQELNTVWKVMQVIEHCITKSNDMLGQSRYATVSEMAERLREQNGGRKDRKNLTGMIGTVDQLLNMDMLTPETYFHKLGEAGEAIFKQMRSAADQQTTVLKEGVERAQTLVEESGVNLRKAEKETHTFSVSGGDLTLSTAQVMELYVLSKREQALEHIYIGGLKPKGVRTGPAGIVETGRAAPVQVTPSDVAEILETLTPEQKKLADGLQAYLSGDLARHGNDASMAVYGYEKFKEENYWPIKVDRNQTKSDVKQEAESKTVAGYGMTKAVKPDASNAVVLRGILDSYTDHLNQMSTYSGWLATSEDVNRIHNYRFTDGKGRPNGTVKTLLEQVYGKNGNSYLDKLMSDIALGTKAGAEPSLADRGLNQFKAAKVGGNLRVILQQPTAIIRAASMMNPKYFMTARNPMKGWETAKEWSPIAQWKDWGYFELDTGRSLKEMIAGESGMLEAAKNKLMEPAGMADSVAWGHLWNAVEAETADRHPELKRGGEDFYRAAAERFGEIIDRTQVVDSVLHRTQIMRSSNSMTRMSTSFMSEPSKIFNMVARDLYDIQAAGSGKERAEAGKNLARSTTALIVSFAVNAVAQSLPDTWRNKDRDKELGEKFTDAYVSNFLENFDPVGYVPYLKDLESIAQGFSVDRSDLEGYSDVVNALGQMKKAWDGESKQSVAAAALELACRGGDLLGLPVSNIKRDAGGMLQTALQWMGDVEAQYALDKLGLNPDKAAATFYDDLYRAMGTDWEQYESIYQDMIDQSWDKEKLKDNMTRRMAEDAGLKKASSLPIEFTPPGLDRSFDQEVIRQLEQGGSWMDALPEGTVELARELEALEPEDGAESVSKLQKIQEVRDSIWGDDAKDLFLSDILSEKEYGRFRDARKAGVSIEKWCRLYEDISQEKVRRTGKAGSPGQDEVAAVLERTSGLTEKQKDAVWDGYGWKSERPTDENVSKSDTKPEGLALPELPRFGG